MSASLVAFAHVLSLLVAGDPPPVKPETKDDSASQVAMEMPEAGGSIRVGRPMEIPQDSTANDEAERFKAKVVAVTHGKFPETTLKLRVVGPAKSPEMQKKLKTITVFTGHVAMGYKNKELDLAHPLTQRNLIGSYLKVGDDVLVHITENKATPGNYLIDYLERL